MLCYEQTIKAGLLLDTGIPNCMNNTQKDLYNDKGIKRILVSKLKTNIKGIHVLAISKM